VHARNIKRFERLSNNPMMEMRISLALSALLLVWLFAPCGAQSLPDQAGPSLGQSSSTQDKRRSPIQADLVERPQARQLTVQPRKARSSLAVRSQIKSTRKPVISP
jgi:hypothetical protein